MALTITALKNIEVTDRDNEDDEGGWMLIVDERFKRQATDIVSGKVYDADGEFEFRVGNYTYFGEFIDWLKSVVDGGVGDFDLLTSFSQDEGVLGSETCRILKKSFLGWVDVAMSNDVKDKDYSDVYCRFLAALSFVEDNGCLIFS